MNSQIILIDIFYRLDKIQNASDIDKGSSKLNDVCAKIMEPDITDISACVQKYVILHAWQSRGYPKYFFQDVT